MDLSRAIVKEFAKITNDTPSSQKDSNQVRGTIIVDNGKKYVQIDGYDILTPISETIDVQDGDRVLVVIDKHTATVIGNYTYPPSARTANEALDKANEAINSSNESKNIAESSKEKADQAEQLAQQANNSAQQAIESSNSAKADAESAHQKAEEANTKSAEAVVKADEAKEAISGTQEAIGAINSEIVLVKNDIAAVRSESTAQIEAVKETLTADYAKKTELTEVEGSLKAEISKSAAELSTTISENYVGKAELIEVKGNLQTQITQNSESITSTASKVEKLETDTSQIQTDLDAAAAIAQEAKDKAEAAKTTADSAQTSANSASQNAQNAKTAADEAKKAADEADAVAKSAQSDLDTAKANLESVSNRVDATEEEIAAAQADVDRAQAAANQAQADATAADAAAKEAQNKADAAQAEAATAKENAKNASKAAADAQAAANKAQADLDAITSRVVTAETKIEQNSESITSIASRTMEVENRFGNYSTTEEMNSAIQQKADSITSSVSAMYATKEEMNSVVDQSATNIRSEVSATYATKDEVDSIEVGGRNLIGEFNRHSSSYAAFDSKTCTMTSTTADNTADGTVRVSYTYVSPDDEKTYISTLKEYSDIGHKSFTFTRELHLKLRFDFYNPSTVSYIYFDISDFEANQEYTVSFNIESLSSDGAGNGGVISHIKVEKGNKSTDFTRAPEDIDSEVGEVRTIAEQTSSKFSWIVESGDSASNFTLTDRTAELVAQNINLNGLVTFSGLNSDTQAKISKIDEWSSSSDTTMIDGGKIYTGSITASKISVDTLEAICAKIGGFTIGNKAIYNGTSSITSTTAGVYLGTDGIRNYKSSSAYVNIKDGVITAKGVDLSGEINASRGSIGGWTVTSEKIYGGDSTTGVAVMQLPSSSNTYVFAAGGSSHSSYADCPFRVTKAGKLYAKDLVAVNEIYLYDEMNESSWVLAKADGGIYFPNEIYFHKRVDLGSSVYFHANAGPDQNNTINLGGTDNRFAYVYTAGVHIGLADYSSKSGNINAYWKDGSIHDIVVRSTDGLTASFGWVGSSSYKTISKIRGQTVQYQNSSGTSTLSDERLKKDFTDLERWESFYMSLEPTAFKYKNGASGRYHMGFGAQHVQKALEENGLTTNDFGGFVAYDVDPNDKESWNGYETEYSLIYTEFTALNTYMTQKNAKRVEKELKSLNGQYSSRLDSALSRIDILQTQLEEAMYMIASQKKEIDNLKMAL